MESFFQGRSQMFCEKFEKITEKELELLDNLKCCLIHADRLTD